MNLNKTVECFQRNGYKVSTFKTAKEAAEYLNREIDGKTVGVGGSMTLEDMGIYDSLSTHNQVFWHWHCENGQTPAQVLAKAATTEVYLTSVNGASEEGELVNIDGTGNRLSSTLYGHEKVYFVMGYNKVAGNLTDAIERARNVASPKNSQRLDRKTPCVHSDECMDCNSPERICNAMVIHFKKMGSCDMEVVIVEEELGY